MKRLTIDVGEDFDNLLTELAKKRNSTKADVIRRAVASYGYLDKHVMSEAGSVKVSIVDKEGMSKDVILP